jgi:hypothetical protein
MYAEVKLCRDDGTVLMTSVFRGPHQGGYVLPPDHVIVDGDLLYYGYELTFKVKEKAQKG